MRRRRTQAEGWVTGHDIKRDPIGSALTGRRKNLTVADDGNCPSGLPRQTGVRQLNFGGLAHFV